MIRSAPRPRPAGPAFALAAALLLAISSFGVASAQGVTWLDAPPRAWNPGGPPLPPRPPASAPNTERCTAQERTPSAAEEAALPAGWRLTTYWPTVRAGDIAVVLATAGYDGMCRPIGYQGFVFAGGRYTGTLAPEPMASRTDGALVSSPSASRVALRGDRIEALFVRYAPTDPLCCPTRGLTRVSYRLERGPDGLVVVPDALAAETVTVQPAPTQLPRTGSSTGTSLAALGAGLVIGGAALRVVRVVRR